MASPGQLTGGDITQLMATTLNNYHKTLADNVTNSNAVTALLRQGDRVRVIETPDGAADNWLEFNLDEVIAVAPAPRPPSPARVSRRRHPLEFDAGPYNVKGIVHLPVGADPRRYVSSTGRRWLPLTECTVSEADDEWAVEVVIVNLDHVSRREASLVAPKFG